MVGADRLLILEVLERMARMDLFLRQSLSIAEEADESVIEAFRKRLHEMKTAAEGWLAPLRRGGESEYEGSRVACLRSAYRTFVQLDRLHLDLSLARSKWTSPEAYTFLSGLRFGPVGLRDAPSAVSIVLSDVYMFEMAELLSYLGTQERPGRKVNGTRPTFYLPKIESGNPLGWASLAHECGHAVAETTFSEFLESAYVAGVGGGEEGRKVFRAWTEELCCDLLACRILGPAYLSAFVSFSSVLASQLGIERATDTHPPASLRVWMMAEFLERIEADYRLSENEASADFLAKCGEERTLLGLTKGTFAWRSRVDREIFWGSGFDSPTIPVDIVEFRDILFDQILKLDESSFCTVRVSDENARAMVSRIRVGVPIGSLADYLDRPHLQKEAQARLQEFNAEVQKAKSYGQVSPDLRNRFRLWLASLNDVPTGIPQILNYGWLYRWEEMIPRFVELFFAEHSETLQAFVLAVNEIERLDRLLAKSIENSYLHEEFGVPPIAK